MAYNSKYTGAEVEAKLDAIDGKQDAIADLDTIRAGASKGATALQSIPSEYVTESELSAKSYATTSALNDKVDKVNGKQLSTEDFTSALKTKLEGLSNYDDTTLANAISGLETRLNTLVNGDASTAIESFNEIIAFLDGVQDTEDLSSIIASIEQQIAGKQNTISDIETIRSGAAKGATALQSYTEKYTGTITGITMNGASKGTSGVVNLGTVITAHQDISGKADKSSLATVATSGSYNDLSNKPTIPSEQVNADWNATSGKAQILNKPTIPSAVTESTVSGWGFTKNTGTYSKPSGGIPKTDLASAVQTSLGKADTALQSYTEQYKGTVTGVKINGTTKNPSSGVVDLGTVITSHQDISGKQDKLVSGTNIKTINGTSILGSGNIEIEGGGSNYYILPLDLGIWETSNNREIQLPQGTFDSVLNAVLNHIPIIGTVKYQPTPCYYLMNAVYEDCVYLNYTDDSKIYYLELWDTDSANVYITSIQEKLVSGTNIKTINGESILGSGDITISGGSSSGGSGAYSEVNHGTADTTFTLTPNTFHVWDEVSELTLTLGSETTGVANEFLFQFTSGATATTFTLPEDIKWANDAPPTIVNNMIYQVSILKGMASVLNWKVEPSIVFPITLEMGYNGDIGISLYSYLQSTYGEPTSGTTLNEEIINNYSGATFETIEYATYMGFTGYWLNGYASYKISWVLLEDGTLQRILPLQEN